MPPPLTRLPDFESYVNGEWSFETKSNSVGVALTVLFFCGLAAVGVLMKG